MDQEIEELKELVRHNTKITEETNKMLHKMQRQARWSMVLRTVWWLTILGVTGAVYYYLLWPYIEQIQEMYRAIGAGGTETQDFFSNFFGR